MTICCGPSAVVLIIITNSLFLLSNIRLYTEATTCTCVLPLNTHTYFTVELVDIP